MPARPRYDLEFHKAAQREWKKLGKEIQKQFTSKLAERLINPRVQADKLHGLKDCYKIKLRSVGCRLLYQVHDGRLVVFVIAVGKRERSEVYLATEGRARPGDVVIAEINEAGTAPGYIVGRKRDS